MNTYDDDKDSAKTKNMNDSDENSYQNYAEEPSETDTLNLNYHQDQSELEEEDEVPKKGKSGKSKLLLGIGAVAAVAAVGYGAMIAFSDDEVEVPQQSTQEKENTKANSEKVSENSGKIKIDESLPEIKKAPVESLDINVNVEPPKVEIQENIFKDVQKREPVETIVPPVQSNIPVIVEPTVEVPVAPIVPEVNQGLIAPVETVSPVIPTPDITNETVVKEEVVAPVINNEAINTMPINVENGSENALIDPDLGTGSVNTSNGMIDPDFNQEGQSVEINTDLNNSIESLIKEMKGVSGNIQSLNNNLSDMNKQVLVNKSDIEKLIKRVEELEKLHRDKEGNMISCVSTCNSDGKVAPVVLKDKPKAADKKVVKKPVYKPANKIEVVSKKGDLSGSKSAKPASKNNVQKSNQNAVVKLESIVGDRAWVRTQNGAIRSYGIGDTLPNGKKIGNIESRSGVFDTNGRMILSR